MFPAQPGPGHVQRIWRPHPLEGLGGQGLPHPEPPSTPSAPANFPLTLSQVRLPGAPSPCQEGAFPRPHSVSKRVQPQPLSWPLSAPCLSLPRRSWALGHEPVSPGQSPDPLSLPILSDLAGLLLPGLGFLSMKRVQNTRKPRWAWKDVGALQASGGHSTLPLGSLCSFLFRRDVHCACLSLLWAVWGGRKAWCRWGKLGPGAWSLALATPRDCLLGPARLGREAVRHHRGFPGFPPLPLGS